jgi:restriction system protein
LPASRTLIVEFQLPAPEDLPTIKTSRLVAATGEIKTTELSQKDQKSLFENVCYQLCLRTIHELFEADTPGHFERVVFNGFVDTIDPATGQQKVAYILSLGVNREDFVSLNLGAVDPKACFKALKGTSAASLAGLAPIAPVLKIDKSDRRFIDPRSVDLDADGATNIAAMDWEDFEHLVRELFEREFASRGGEVKVTRSSGDGGVDAVAFDPDPITGGKIVIQAKRYTKTVGVSAVRDLYGTLMSEGATKGILVTTADYGPDAHKFAADKPISLLNGANLLHLLEKHGTKAKIDLADARKTLGLR